MLRFIKNSLFNRHSYLDLNLYFSDKEEYFRRFNRMYTARKVFNTIGRSIKLVLSIVLACVLFPISIVIYMLIPNRWLHAMWFRYYWW